MATPKQPNVGKKFKSSNLNQLLGAPKESGQRNFGPAVRSAALIKPAAKPKGLVSLGKAPVSASAHPRKGAAWSQLEEKAKERREEETQHKADPEWAVLDFRELDKPPQQDGEEEDDEEEEEEEEEEEDQSLQNLSGLARGSPNLEGSELDAVKDVLGPGDALGERQFSKSHRSYLSMEYAPGTERARDEPTAATSSDVQRRPRREEWAFASDDDEELPISRRDRPQPPSMAAPAAPRAMAPVGPPPQAPPSRPRPPGPPPPMPPPGPVHEALLEARGPGPAPARRHKGPPAEPARPGPGPRPTAWQTRAAPGPEKVAEARAMEGAATRPSQHSGPHLANSAFGTRAPVNRPMSEEFVNSGWKQKKLWEPPKPEPKPLGGRSQTSDAPNTAGMSAGPRSRLRAQGSADAEGADDQAKAKFDATPGGATDGSEKAKAKVPKQPRQPLDPLEPESSSDDGSDGSEVPPEYAVLDLTVPRTALVINVTHVLKRLNGCCSLNQLNKALKDFKLKTGVTLEAFLRGNPGDFKLEGRIVYLVDQDGEKWTPPGGVPVQHGKGKQKGGGDNKSYDAEDRRRRKYDKHSGGNGYHWNDESWSSSSWGNGWAAAGWNSGHW